MSCRGYSIIYPTRCERMLARRCRQQLIKSDLVGMRALSISFSSLGKEGGEGIRRVRVLRTVSAGNLLSQVGLARNLAIACCHATAVGQKPSRR